MGIKILGNISDSSSVQPKQNTTPNPNPFVFNILGMQIEKDALVAMVNYPHCTTFEGKKILVFKGMTAKELVNLDKLDPHFYEDSKLVARFAPTKEGWDRATKFAKML